MDISGIIQAMRQSYRDGTYSSFPGRYLYLVNTETYEEAISPEDEEIFRGDN